MSNDLNAKLDEESESDAAPLKEAGEADLTQELKVMKDKYLRAKAEEQNLKMRHRKEFQEHFKYSIQTFIKALLPSIDNLCYLLDHNDNDDIRAILSSFLKTLEEFHVSTIDPSVGEVFDAAKHEALSTVDSDKDNPANTIIKKLQLGFKLHERLLRPSRVIVATDKKEEKDE